MRDRLLHWLFARSRRPRPRTASPYRWSGGSAGRRSAGTGRSPTGTRPGSAGTVDVQFGQPPDVRFVMPLIRRRRTTRALLVGLDRCGRDRGTAAERVEPAGCRSTGCSPWSARSFSRRPARRSGRWQLGRQQARLDVAVVQGPPGAAVPGPLICRLRLAASAVAPAAADAAGFRPAAGIRWKNEFHAFCVFPIPCSAAVVVPDERPDPVVRPEDQPGLAGQRVEGRHDLRDGHASRSSADHGMWRPGRCS